MEESGWRVDIPINDDNTLNLDEMYIGSDIGIGEDYLSNWNLKSFDNLYASLAESAYRYRPKNFPYEQLNPERQKALDSGKSVEFSFSTDGKDSEGQVTHGGGTDLPNGGKVYLQPDSKKLLEDEETGYNAYYVTDTETINANTHQTYFFDSWK